MFSSFKYENYDIYFVELGRPVKTRDSVTQKTEGRQQKLENPRQPKLVKEGGGKISDHFRFKDR